MKMTAVSHRALALLLATPRFFAALRAENASLLADIKGRDEQLYQAARDVVTAKREALDARVRLARGEAQLAASHKRMGDAGSGARRAFPPDARRGDPG